MSIQNVRVNATSFPSAQMLGPQGIGKPSLMTGKDSEVSQAESVANQLFEENKFSSEGREEQLMKSYSIKL